MWRTGRIVRQVLRGLAWPEVSDDQADSPLLATRDMRPADHNQPDARGSSRPEGEMAVIVTGGRIGEIAC